MSQRDLPRVTPLSPQERHIAAQGASAALTPPGSGSGADSDDQRPGGAVPEEASGSQEPEEGTASVDGAPRQGSRTLIAGTAEPRCRHCATRVGGTQQVVQCPEGWCIATLCRCSRAWYTRESPVYADRQAAVAALIDGDYARDD